jgi:hypothetical protein
MDYLLERFRRLAMIAGAFIALTASNVLFAQGEELGPRCGKSYVSEVGAGYNWAEPGNARCDDDESRAYTAPLTKDQFSQALKITNFGFKLPLEAKIEGIEVVMIRKADVGASIQDKRVVLLRGNQAVGTSLHTQDTWDAEWTAAYYGEAHENWDATWKVADINAPGFGISIEVQCIGAISRPQIDEVLVTIHYSYAGESARWYRSNSQKFSCTPVGG